MLVMILILLETVHGRRDVTLLLHLCYLNMIRCDDCVTSYKDAVHESLIEVLGWNEDGGGKRMGEERGKKKSRMYTSPAVYGIRWKGAENKKEI